MQIDARLFRSWALVPPLVLRIPLNGSYARSLAIFRSGTSCKWAVELRIWSKDIVEIVGALCGLGESFGGQI